MSLFYLKGFCAKSLWFFLFNIDFNRIWLKLGAGEFYPLADKTEFRVGYSYNLLVKSGFFKLFDKKNKPKKCLICNQEENNVILIPCDHNRLFGMKCLREGKASSCPECFAYIHNYMQLYS